ncbi:MAG: lysophospholipase L1-like esterase [Pseudoalteromonas rhizosphaerae]|jgi:lysophospholipase L1-like esterase|uniref:SGNH hydrolase-type esterase domain-containing protein n=1 Tax=Pseudoalteromonas neustonica TaxID=1840331 RepID=A0ABY3FI92_9GAMM|nr:MULTISPECIES: GDSL-type esterase/lipase family protein [Pseudoalteromonas]MBB1300143.1 hypothetical protein [Pseudoalteromonas sp. SR44-8]MBB1308046.1 hypothetical protein [Pseudoalteromonas sp. SR41-8]MBB1407865.1 hypothetical protein [Pseudoalteromonas sp. SG44-17]TVU85561.1 hypothetical protein FQP85_04365 [Pseudoalteromonas neustonica]|tara:strand:+ start:7010 stop:7630 length:621 start_codon:yes stop_codon:yes gene_type:complete
MNILCFGDSNTFGISPVDGKRLSETERWPTLLKQQLGTGFEVIEAGEPNRTLVNNPPFMGDKSGIKYLKPYLEAHTVDVVIIQLGTNDLKARFDLTPEQIAGGLDSFITAIKLFYQQSMIPVPSIVVISVANVIANGAYKKIYAGAEHKVMHLAAWCKKVTNKHNCILVDAFLFIKPCQYEGVHWPSCEHKKLADNLYQYILEQRT